MPVRAASAQASFKDTSKELKNIAVLSFNFARPSRRAPGMRQSTPDGWRKARQSGQRTGIARSRASLVLGRGFGETSVLSPLALSRGQVLFAGGDSRLLAVRIGKSAVAVSPEHALNWQIDARPFQWLD
jgi:hypothetical protein